jgi:hypothetical protein
MAYALKTYTKENTSSISADSIVPSAPPNIISPEVIEIPFEQSFHGFDECSFLRSIGRQQIIPPLPGTCF